MRDLVTVYSYSLLWSVFNKPKNNNKGTFKTALKETKNLLIRFSLKSLDFSAVVNILYFLYTYAAAVIRVCFHRKVAKKYNLTLK